MKRRENIVLPPVAWINNPKAIPIAHRIKRWVAVTKYVLFGNKIKR